MFSFTLSVVRACFSSKEAASKQRIVDQFVIENAFTSDTKVDGASR